MKVEQIPSFLHITVHKSAHVKAPFSGRYNTGDPLPQIVSNKTKYKKNVQLPSDPNLYASHSHYPCS